MSSSPANARPNRQPTTLFMKTIIPMPRLCELVDIQPMQESITLKNFADASRMADISLQERLTAGIQVFLDLTARNNSQIEKIDKGLLDQYIAQIDQTISEQLDAVLHHPSFQSVESSWRGLQMMIQRCDFRRNTKVEILDCTKDDLRDDFEEAPEVIQTGLYQHVYVNEYDTPGGRTVRFGYSAITNLTIPLRILPCCAKCQKFLPAPTALFWPLSARAFFGKKNVDEIAQINDLTNYMEKAEYTRWKSFRGTEDARYIGLPDPPRAAAPAIWPGQCPSSDLQL